MKTYDSFYINGQWVKAQGRETFDVINPATEAPVARVPMGSPADVDAAVAAARAAFDSWSATSAQTRCDLINKVAELMKAREADLVEAVSSAMGCPRHLTPDLQVKGPTFAMASFAERAFVMEQSREAGNSLVVKEPVGVCGFINPWNYPLHQFVGKVAPALAAGCTMVIKPSEQTPLQDLIMAEIMHEAGIPAGVFNLVIGAGPVVGAAISSHPQVDMVSFTGSTRAGKMIAQAAAETVKRVTQELGGKSPYIITEDADLEAAVKYGVEDVMINSGQTCTALTRMLVPASRYEEAVAIAKAHTESLVVGAGDDAFVGPMSSARQLAVVQSYIDKGLAEGARLVTGGPGKPEHLGAGFYAKPTIFADVTNNMAIAREEIFGPVLCMIAYHTEAEAIAIANDTPYGLSSGVYAKNKEAGIAIARKIRAGQCYVNGGSFNYLAPFGGYKQSGNGREFGEEGMHEFIETKAMQL
ncbi:aldehyde dehydrogenase family protein [Simiduia sp. 21SJ11W-1]|uniref:aldehyde dehydrogenase family protein n=1 Tax=Simiduia sp. 21SJ11W-1 TaxID=2909669 RepID=UPI00209F2A93|nr:aldehyde dehydrogenase family protein [Simiduia sp. 21SJ11W-1]UTA46924.1 aldehyde dehydrogenase family protein [Simiduia sp. 21SJ11W-1]